jgi:hypothetical protein
MRPRHPGQFRCNELTADIDAPKILSPNSCPILYGEEKANVLGCRYVGSVMPRNGPGS